jgi:hypothetical protein
VEGFGLGAKGYAGEARGDIRPFRLAQDRGEYRRVRQLSGVAVDTKSPTLKEVIKKTQRYTE